MKKTKEGRDMKHGSLFSGIGGFDYAALLLKWNNVFHCENNEWCQKVLNKNFPKSKLHADITTTDFSIYRGCIDVLSGGFPCQDISVASSNGKKGLEGKSSGLWYQMLRAVYEIRPSWIVCENVYALTTQDGGLAIETVISGIESKGYEVLPPIVIPAIATGANHIRKRVWIIAHSISERNRIQEGKIQTGRDIIKHSAWWDTEPGICRVYDGISDGLDKNRLRGLGNAIVPQIALNIFSVIDHLTKPI